MELPVVKSKNLISLIETIQRKSHMKIREFSKFIGTLVSVCPAVPYSWAHIKNFEREKYKALKKSKGDYDGTMQLPKYLQSDFFWWLSKVKTSKKSLTEPSYTLTIFTDASSSGWGASCEKSITWGFWNSIETTYHINYLELLAAFNDLKSFGKNYKTAIFYYE